MPDRDPRKYLHTTCLTESESDHVTIRAVRSKRSVSDVIHELVVMDMENSKTKGSIDRVLELMEELKEEVRKFR